MMEPQRSPSRANRSERSCGAYCVARALATNRAQAVPNFEGGISLLSVQAESQIREMLEELDTSPQSGLSDEVVRERLRVYGPNEIRESAHQSALSMLFAQFKGVMSLLLIVAGIISAATGDIKDTIVIAAVVILNAIMGFVQEYRAEKAISALKKLAVPNAKAIRNGRLADVPAHELVPGDVVRLQAGDLVPADGRLIEAVNLNIEEATLTGESVPSEKDALHLQDPSLPVGDRRSEVFMGTTVTQGRGTFVVSNTGMVTQLGNIAEMIGANPEKQTPLQKRLAQLGLYLAIGAVVICAIVFAAGVIQGRDLKMMLLAAISLAVAAVPESLPAVITISLALGAQRMVKRHALIRKLPAVETLGCVTAICSDKTGTLTQNRMQVESICAGGNLLKREGKNFIGVGNLLGDGKLVSIEDANLKAFLEAVSLCNDAEVQASESGEAQILGDPTETSLVHAALDAGLNLEESKLLLPRIAEIPFDSARKRMTTIHKGQKGLVYSFTKGALDVVLPRCSYEMSDGALRELTSERISEILTLSEQFASRGSRVMAAASRSFEKMPKDITEGAIEADMVFLGFAGISDPPRSEAAAAVQKCKDAGIHVAMITGDHKLTAAAIGSDLGIASANGGVCAGASLDEMDDAALAQEVTHCRVFARVSPEHKVRIVSALQDNGHIVAMTGDGVNDAPSLKRADVGVAMGITGTDVSREAADIVLTDDNFATIVSAVEEGRTIYDNIRKFVRYTLATNFGEVLTMFFGMLAGLPLPLLPIQILWINLVTDGLPALALGVEPAEGDVMKRPPRNPNESLFARGLWQHIVWVGALMAIGTLVMFNWEIKAKGVEYARTMAFYTLAAYQLFHVLAIRRERQSAFRSNLGANKFLTLAVIGTFALQILITYISPLAHIFKNVPISFGDLMLCTALASSVFFAVELEKVFYRRHSVS